MFSELSRIVDQISRDKGIDKNQLIESLEEAVMQAARKKFGQRRDMEVRYNEELGEIELFQFRTVVEKVEDEQTEISLEEALALDPEVELGDDIGSKMDNVAQLGRVAAQSAKQVIIQKMKDAESDVVYEMYKGREGEIVNGIVQRFERGSIIVNLGRTDAVLPASHQMPRRSYRPGDRIRAYLLEVKRTARESPLVLSRTEDDFLSQLFTEEVPEIAEGVVKIMGVVREPGSRAKIAVSSSESDVDPVGACVGMKGSRVQNVVQELQGEKIDIVPWSPDPARFVSNALAPAQVSMVVVDEARKTLLVVAPDDQLSLAIGRQGQNVRLASKLLGWNIDVKGERKYAMSLDEDYRSLLAVEGVDDKLAEKLYDAEITSSDLLAKSSVAELMTLELFDEKTAEALIEAAAAVPAPAGEEADKDEQEAVTEGRSAAPADLAGKTNAELRKMCAAAGITGVSKKTKDELLAVLRDAESAGGGDEGEAAS
ncbi:MAG: transcription termination factor NusA [Desulfurivibrionaceae bacterium]|nr:transcription termination factor NusA [Desulfobulbales bacterium]MDT8336019.1 transcription termination factor NusA [Desulfurivibrionaceae bacterium]